MGEAGETDVVTAGVRVQQVRHRNHTLIEPPLLVVILRARVGCRVCAWKFQLKRIAHDDAAHPVCGVDEASNRIDREVRRDLRVAEQLRVFLYTYTYSQRTGFLNINQQQQPHLNYWPQFLAEHGVGFGPADFGHHGAALELGELVGGPVHQRVEGAWEKVDVGFPWRRRPRLVDQDYDERLEDVFLG